jgi:hypothetical protein
MSVNLDYAGLTDDEVKAIAIESLRYLNVLDQSAAVDAAIQDVSDRLLIAGKLDPANDSALADVVDQNTVEEIAKFFADNMDDDVLARLVIALGDVVAKRMIADLSAVREIAR